VLFDYQLQQMAASLTGVPITGGVPPGAPPGSDALVVQVWDRNGVQVYLSQPQSNLPQHARLGFNTIATDHGQWRVFSTFAAGQIVQVAQPMAVRGRLAASMALRTIAPLLIVIPFLGVLVWYAIARTLRPLDRLASALGTRVPGALDPLPEGGVPSEVTPLVQALNGLLDRLRHALQAQRTFIADAAHELRTPLTAVHLQAQLAERAPTDAERRAALAELRVGLERATHVVDQLLTLAREEPGVIERPLGPVDVAALAREVVEEHAAIASARDIDFGMAPDGAPHAIAWGDRAGLRTLLANLIDNALRYTPRGGRVDVAVERAADAVTLAVRDSGPGIAPVERERVFDRFYRGEGTREPGSGLGLAIVKRIAERHGATVALGPGLPRAPGDTAQGAGLSVSVRLPGAPALARRATELPAMDA